MKRTWNQNIALGIGAVAVMVGLLSCSKKDIKPEESAMNPSEGATAATAANPEAGVAGESTQDLQTAYFDFDSFQLRGDAKEALQQNVDWLKSNPNATIQIEGHCDERGTVEYNLALGEKRANAARRYLTSHGIAKKRVSVISYGKERPADSGHDETAWAKNRRAVPILLSR